MPHGGSVVGLDFDAAQAWPAYDWMGVAKAALEATCRYLARDLGPSGCGSTWWRRVLRTLAARSIPDFAALEDLAEAGAARLGRARRRARGQGVRGPAVGLVPGHDRRDPPRGRRRPRRGAVAGEAQDRLAMLPAADPAEAATLEAGASADRDPVLLLPTGPRSASWTPSTSWCPASGCWPATG